MTTTRLSLAALTTAFAATTVSAQTVTVNQFEAGPVPAVPTPDAWYESDIRGAGTASIVELTGVGGDLENNQPLPTGAALLTTGGDNNDKAEVGTFADFGSAAEILTTGTLGYSYYKENVVGGNAFAAPSLKLNIFAAGGTGDNFGTLVYEPTWNQPGGGSAAVPTDAWQDVTIAASTGAGDNSSGGWWWTGGFGEGNTAGGPPIRSLDEWAALFTANDPVDFANARVVGISVGVGTFNLDQVGYFDDVSLTTVTGGTKTYDFQVPEPAGFAVLGLGGLAMLNRRRA